MICVSAKPYIDTFIIIVINRTTIERIIHVQNPIFVSRDIAAGSCRLVEPQSSQLPASSGKSNNPMSEIIESTK